MAKVFPIDTDGNLTTGIFGHWPMKNDSTDIIAGNNGTDTAMSYSGTEATFNGSTSNIVTSNDANWTKLAIHFEIVFNTLGGADRQFFNKTKATLSVAGDFEVQFGIFGSGTVYGIVINNSVVGSFVNTSGNITTGVRYFFAINIDEDGDTAAFYQNTVSKMSTASATQTHNNLTEGFNWGVRRDGFGPLDATMRRLTIWTGRNLSTNNIADLYNSGNGQDMIDGGKLPSGVFVPPNQSIVRASNW